jgi:hypothetical protein
MNYLKMLFGRGCSHRFSWPRIDAGGHHYQICSDCGTAYEYDWKMMRRTERLPVTALAHRQYADSFARDCTRS